MTEAFQKACLIVEKNGTKINQPNLLKLYSYYKQATEGDASGKRPGLINLRARAKYDGWKSLEGMSPEEAKGKYIRVVSELEFVESEITSFEDKHAEAKEMLNKELDLEEIKKLKIYGKPIPLQKTTET